MIETFGPSVVWRYELPEAAVGGTYSIPLPASASVVKVDLSHRDGLAAIWVLMSADDQGQPCGPMELRSFRIFGTGHPIPGKHRYVGSTPEGPFVWHVFEKIKS